MTKLYRKLEDVLNLAKSSGPDDIDLAKMVLGVLEESGVSTMTMVLHLNEVQKQKAARDSRDYQLALDAACCALTDMTRKVIKESKGHPKSFVDKVLLSPKSISNVVYFLKMWVPDPEKGGYSTLSSWMLDKVLATYNLTSYMPGGSSHDWARQYGNYDYICRLKAVQDARVQ